MPRKSRAKAEAIGEPAAAVLEQLNEQGADLKAASELPRQLPPPEPTLDPLLRAEAEPPVRELIEPTPNAPRPRPFQRLNGTERESEASEYSHAAAVLASRSSFRPVPQGYMNVDSYPVAGLKVNKALDKKSIAIQFADDKLPDREEKDALQIRKINYDPPTKQWTRRDAENTAANLIDAKDMGAELAAARAERGR